MKLARVWLGLAACVVALMVACYPSLHPNLARAGGVIFKPPTPCTSTGQTNCQPTFNAATATPTTPPSTPGPLSLATSSAAFANPSSTPATFAIADPNFSGFYSTSVNPSGVVTAGVSGSTLTVSVVAPGNTTVSVSDGYNSVPLTVSVGTPGPLALNTPSASFASSGAPAQTFTISDPGAPVSYFSTATSPTGIVTSSVANHTLTVTPVAAGNTSVSVTDGYNTTYLSVAVLPASTPGPLAWTASSQAFANPSATPVAIGVTDPNFMGTFTASSSNNAVVTAVGGTTSVTISVVGPGSANVTVGDGYNTAVLSPVTVGTPGPLAVSASSVSFGGPFAAPTSVAVTDPGGVVTVSPTPAGIVSASISGNVIQLTPETVGTASAKVSDGYNTVSIALAVPSPTPIYTNAVPGNVATPSGSQVWPQGGAITFPTPGAFSIVAQINCMPGTAQAANGSAILGIGSGVQFKAGRCGGSTVTNPNNVGTSTQVYLSQGGANAQPTYELNSNTPYTLVATDDGSSTLSYWVCSYGTVTCSQYTGAVTGPATFTSATGYIGIQSDNATRPFAGDIWNIQMFNTLIGNTPTNMAAAVTALQTADPYPTPYVLPSPVYTNPAPNNTATPSGSLVWPGPQITFPTPAAFTWIAQIQCNPTSTQTTNGSTIMSIGAAANYITMKAGTCSGLSQTNGSTAAQAYIANSGNSSTPANQLTADTSSTVVQYLIAVTNDASNNLTYYVCTYPTSISCTAAPVGSTTTAATFGAATGYIGSEWDGTTRPFAGDIWNVRIYNSALVTSCNSTTSTPCPAMAAVASAIATADPFPTPAVANAYPAPSWVPFVQPAAGATPSSANYSTYAVMQVPVTTLYGSNPTTTGTCPVSDYYSRASSSNGCYDKNSATIISHLLSTEPGPSGNWGGADQNIGTLDYFAASLAACPAAYSNCSGGNATAYYQTSSSDPTLNSKTGSGCSNYGPSQTGLSNFHYKTDAVQQYGLDRHIAIYDTSTDTFATTILSGQLRVSNIGTGGGSPTGNSGYWPGVTQPGTSICPGTGNSNYTNGAVLSTTLPSQPGTISWANTHTAGGVNTNGLSIPGTAGGIAFSYGITPQEIVAGRIPHALLYDTSCEDLTVYNYLYPAHGSDNANQCTTAGAPANTWMIYGMHLWVDTAPTITGTCDQISYVMLRALNEFGAYFNDAGNGNNSQVQNNYLNFHFMQDSNDTISAGHGVSFAADGSIWTPLFESVISNPNGSYTTNSGAFWRGNSGSNNVLASTPAPAASPLQQGGRVSFVLLPNSSTGKLCGIQQSNWHVLIAPYEPSGW